MSAKTEAVGGDNEWAPRHRDLDVEEAQKFLYSAPDIDLLPNLHCRLNAKDAAFILSVSVPTIKRLFDRNLPASDGDGSTSKDSLIEFIERNYLAALPVL